MKYQTIRIYKSALNLSRLRALNKQNNLNEGWFRYHIVINPHIDLSCFQRLFKFVVIKYKIVEYRDLPSWVILANTTIYPSLQRANSLSN